MSSDHWSGWKKVGFIFVACAVLWAIILYGAGQIWPWDTTGEGPWRENYP